MTKDKLWVWFVERLKAYRNSIQVNQKISKLTGKQKKEVSGYWLLVIG
ncbi:MAG: hypothetical protein KME60_31500 [Cyanomargarita calcarea GSE-NOS-MK-12-04C]|jgi:hypothetical protein|uniref:Uncharacterized protein n=1 Tax=Cyanomargarita calcarea GSE-NOS-MK-12-04C TaxID=2839659 RepID=A0A951QX50_9CYAN|nr:hypothetical protein [Cyanomargarita calcarea GSE-NOS-MK-12-04C]